MSQLLTLQKRFVWRRPLSTNQTHGPRRPFCSIRMSSPTHSPTLPGQSDQPVNVIAASSVNHTQFRNAVESSLFKQWLVNLQSENGILVDGSLSLREVLIQGVDMFGQRVGFLKFKADIFDKETGQKVPGLVFARGPAVTVQILLESEGETYAVLTEQVRVPTGRFVLELPAGMLDDDKNDFVGTAVREGGCDEEISWFLYRGSVEKEIITQLQGKETGLREHGELIKVRVVPYAKLWCTTADAKVLMAIALYEMAKREGLLPSNCSGPQTFSHCWTIYLHGFMVFRSSPNL